jgi:2-oxoglutarate ferredoxin oxidoreductase subunit gamma
MRGGSSECAVILSDDAIACPILEQSDNVLVLASHLFKTFMDRIRPGGLVVVGSLGLDKDIDSSGFNMVVIPDVEKEASDIGAAVVSNTIMLGAYIQITEALSPEAMEAELAFQFGKKEKVLALNKKALQRGIELAKSVA